MGRVRASQDQTDTGPDKDRLCQPTRLGWRYGYTAHRVFLICSGPFSLSRPATFQSPATFWSRCINFEMSRILFTLIFVSQIKNKLEVYDIISGHKREEKQQRLTTQHENINSIASSFNFDISWLKIPQTITQNCTPKQPIWDDKDMSSSSHFLSKPGHLGTLSSYLSGCGHSWWCAILLAFPCPIALISNVTSTCDQHNREGPGSAQEAAA